MRVLARADGLLASAPAAEDDASRHADDAGSGRPQQRVQDVAAGRDDSQHGAGADVLRVVVAKDRRASVADALLEDGDLASVEGRIAVAHA